MSTAFSAEFENVYVDVEEILDTDLITLAVFTGDKETVDITLEAADLVRALITASPAFAREVGALAREAIISYFEQKDAEED